MTDQVLERFWDDIKLDQETGCWNWQGQIRGGYGRFFTDGRRVSSHRFSYEVNKGPIPEGLTIDHLCHNTRCVNPDHLEPVTNKENSRRGNNMATRHAKQTHCIHGHEFSGYNLKIRYRKNGVIERICRKCKNIARMERYYREQEKQRTDEQIRLLQEAINEACRNDKSHTKGLSEN